LIYLPAKEFRFKTFIPKFTFKEDILIQNGCDKFCSFCAVPFTRGREVSRPSKDILAEVAMLVSQGYKSITLLGKTVRVLVRGEDRREGFLSALTEGKLSVRFPAENENLTGQFVDVKITSASDFSLEGELVKVEAFV
jgi:tRNA A37 methylthiotransferase MiaB